MKRDDFLKSISLLGAGALLPVSKAHADTGAKPASCVLIPSETEGPFPLDLTTNNSATYFRQDIRETCAGVELRLKMKIIGKGNCLPMQNVRVNVWHCDKNGTYSGYATPMNPGGSASTTWLRGYQMTDANGEVEFITIFPGHYNGRVTHIHFQVYVSPVYRAVSQMTWDVATKNNFYAANSSVYTNGPDPQSLTSDNVFSDGYALQLATLTDNGDGTYSSYLEVTIDGSGTSTGIRDYEGETGGQFSLGQNFPNPHVGATTVPFTLNAASDVQLDIYDLTARRVASLPQGKLSEGDYKVAVDLQALGLSRGNYLYQIQVSNDKGVFRQCKMMTGR